MMNTLRIACTCVVAWCAFLVPVLNARAGNLPYADSIHAVPHDIVVAQDGSGTCTTMQEAFNAVPDNSGRRTVIFVKNGTYREKLVLRATKKNVTLIGESADSVILTYDDHTGKVVNGDSINTWTSWSTLIEGDGFVAENVTFANSAGRVGQAVALEVRSDRVWLKKCRLIGNQDTFFANSDGRIFVEECYIEGTTDFIFGKAVAFFERCLIHSMKKSHVTAASTPEGNRFGYVFHSCVLTGDSGLQGVTLGRPWRPFARVVYLECTIGSHIDPAGWNNWRNPENEKTAYYAEYKSGGPGGVASDRVAWSHQLTDDEAAIYTIRNVFSSKASAVGYASDWIPGSD
jgi:pectinesterase